MQNWLVDFKTQYEELLNFENKLVKFHRYDGFRFIFEKLISKKESNFKIIETGTLRNPGAWSDGQSAFLFVEFVKVFGGQVKSVDIDITACTTATNFLDPKHFSVTNMDSVEWLSQEPLIDVDLFYLDSYDVDYTDDKLSAEHHLKEFKKIEPFLQKGTIVAIDDNMVITGDRSGKGRMIVEYLEAKGIYPLYDKYQIVYEF